VTTDQPSHYLYITWRWRSGNLFANHQSKRFRQTAGRRYRTLYSARHPLVDSIRPRRLAAPRTRPLRVLDMSVMPSSTCRDTFLRAVNPRETADKTDASMHDRLIYCYNQIVEYYFRTNPGSIKYVYSSQRRNTNQINAAYIYRIKKK